MPIYLDNSATTQVRQEVVDAMLPYLTQNWGNPSSIHSLGRKSKKAIQTARQRVAQLLNCDQQEVYFSSGGTMSNNVAILGRARFAEANDLGSHLITTGIEHPSVMGPARYLESRGWNVTCLPVDKEGFVHLDNLKKAVTDKTSIISIMWANNEIGTVEPIQELANWAHNKGIFFHTDAVQVPGKLAIDLHSVQASALSLSGHKFYAPKGIGVLFARKGENIMPVLFGGGQEMGLLPGTEAVANVVAIGKAAELAFSELQSTKNRLIEMQRLLLTKLKSLEDIRITGPSAIERRVPGHLSFVLPGNEGEALVMRADLNGICISSGSACHQGIIEPSSVLKAIGLSDTESAGSIRISLGRFNSQEECERVSDVFLRIFKSQNKIAVL